MDPDSFHSCGEPVNDGERIVLRTLRDGLDDGWWVIGNFEFPSDGGRWYECDALVVSPAGYAYLVETKHWTGQIRGTDGGWNMPSLDGKSWTKRQAPIHVLTSKVKKLASWLASDTLIGNFPIYPLVVLVSDLSPELVGKSAATTVLYTEVVNAIRRDPRTDAQIKNSKSADTAAAVFKKLRDSSRIPTETAIGNFQLDELEEMLENGTEIWRGHPASTPKVSCRLKRYRIDHLASAEDRDAQLKRARQDLEILLTLGSDDIVQTWGPPFEDGQDFVVVSLVPKGTSVQEMLLGEAPNAEVATECAYEMFRVLARIHQQGVTHRNIRPGAIWLDLTSGSVRLTDFDFSRLESRSGVTKLVSSGDTDLEFRAPEVAQEFSRADERSDLYSLARVAERLLERAGSSADERLAVVLEQCGRSNPADRPASAADALRLLEGSDRPLGLLEEQDVLDGRYVVRSRHSSGGLTVVYRVFDVLLDREFGAKFVRPEYSHQLQAETEWLLLEGVPNHPNIAKPIFVGDVQKVQRGDHVTLHQEMFLISDWIEGKSLDLYIEQGIPLVRTLQIGADVLDGLAHLHGHSVIHRDIKPDNVMVKPDGRAVILDFNVSTTAEPDLVTKLGTPAYRAPEREWSFASDLYSVGVCLVELLAGKRLGKDAADWIRTQSDNFEPGIGQIFGELLSVDPGSRGSALDRGIQLRQLASTLRHHSSVDDPPPALEGDFPNVYVERLMSFFSQSIVSNAGTRGLDKFAKWLYVDTEIDRQLKPAILQGRPSLVVITGNAGDGKTAFIRGVEADLALIDGAVAEAARAGNGAVIETPSHIWLTNWDGSQDESGQDNTDVLNAFFAPFAGNSLAPATNATHVIAINEGRLVDFLEENAETFSGLRDLVNGLFAGTLETEPEWLVLINLNRRVLTADGVNTLVAELLNRMSDERIWSACATCPAVHECPSYSNAAVLRDPILGPRSAERIRETLDVVRLRRRLHITTRDLLSTLAYILVGNRSCSDIISDVQSGATLPLVMGHMYNRMFSAGTDELTEGAIQDRLLRELAVLDVAETTQPELDGKLWLLGLEGTDSDFTHRPDGPQLQSLLDGGDPSIRLLVHRFLRRKLYLEREDPSYLEMLPYTYLLEFQESLSGELPEMGNRIARALSASEGLRDVGDVVAVRLVDDLEARDRSFVTRPFNEFDLSVFDESGTARFVEYRPEILRYTSLIDPTLVLDIDLDVFEALMRMHRGFTPSREDLRGSWLSLATFKERLASMPSRALLLQSAGGSRTAISVDFSGVVHAQELT